VTKRRRAQAPLHQAPGESQRPLTMEAASGVVGRGARPPRATHGGIIWLVDADLIPALESALVQQWHHFGAPFHVHATTALH
jgi:hypothetical protein